jgi:hypothetical protein
METETVSAHSNGDTSLAVLFQPLPKTDKGPIMRVLVSLPRPLNGMVAECAIFADRDGAQTGVTVTLPGASSRFPAFKAEKQLVEGADGKIYRLHADDPVGLRKIGAWAEQIKTAYHAFLQTGNAEQRISL